jgi:primosomal protein N' (replication factor Y) (superfamily II helicase)
MTSIARVQPMTTTRALRGPFDYRLPEDFGDGAVDVGSMLVVPFARRLLLGVVVGLAERSEVREEKLLEPLRALELGVPAELVRLAQWIAAEYCSTLARALTLVLPPGAARRLGGRRRRPAAAVAGASGELSAPGASRPDPPPLTTEQQHALDSLALALERREFAQRLLQGVTGSGKTEVYLGAATIALGQGRGAIVLVPEIALTPQIVGRFRERFGNTVAVLHSRLRPAERYEQWRRLRTGEARVCVGPRSAVFAPIADLGLIVVDEEHDGSYKHEGDPRYDARDVAAERARACGALLLLGSATPRPESVAGAGYASPPPASVLQTSGSSAAIVAASGSEVLRLSERVDGRPLPAVEILDMRGQGGPLHPLTAQALAEVRAARGKAIVLLNRRGWSNFLSCRSCGAVWTCPECDVALVLHGREGFLACHHCGHREPAPSSCEHCGSISVARHGAGTERLQHDLTAALDGDGRFPVFRLDADTMASGSAAAAGAEGPARSAGLDSEQPGDVASLLCGFRESESGVLLGTQMVAKGHDFLDVSLGVVLDADATLRFPDFRADERTFALVAQLAGRVGRGGEGRVLVQSIAPEARAIAYAARHDSDGFLESELRRRRELSYPPYSHLIRIVCAAAERPPAREAASELVRQLSRSLSGARGPGGVNGAGAAGAARPAVLGPAALFRLRRQEREMVLIKTPERRVLARAVGEMIERIVLGRRHPGVSFSVDVDPQ